jgi:Ca2+-binding RTX toxin-like protein
VLATVLLLVPQGAPAATVSGGAGSFRFQAAPGETNQVHAYSNDRFLGFRDAKAQLTAGPGCQLTGDGAIECLHHGVPLARVEVDLGDGNDALNAGDLRDGASLRPHAYVLLDGGDGNDEISQSAFGTEPDKVGLTRGGAGADRLRGGGVLDGGPDDDRVLGTYGYSHDRVIGGDGHDVVDGGGGPDEVSGGPGDDTMYEGTDLCQYEGWCEYQGPPGTNYVPNDDAHLDGGPGNDRMGAGGNSSTIAGGPGDDDIVSFAVWADGGEGNDRLRGGPVLRGGDGDDELTGSSAKRSYPYPLCCVAYELLEGGPGADSLASGALNTVLDGGEGPDAMTPGPATDTLSYRSRAAGVRIDLSAPDATGGLAAEGDRATAGFERIEGSAGDDEILAGTSAVAIDGFLGRDRIVGSQHADVLSGGGHDDVVLGGGGNDILEGGDDSYRDPAGGERVRAEGNDLIDGGPGNDSIAPGGGEDWVLAGSGDDFVDSHERAGPFGRHPLNHSHIIQMSGADQVFCGKGADAVAADYADALGLDCETTDEGTPRWRQVKVTFGRSLRLTVRCAWADDRPCKGIATLRTASGVGDDSGGPSVRSAPARCRAGGGTRIARSGFRIRAGRVNYVYLRLTSAGERLVRRRGCVAVHATLEIGRASCRDRVFPEV